MDECVALRTCKMKVTRHCRIVRPKLRWSDVIRTYEGDWRREKDSEGEKEKISTTQEYEETENTMRQLQIEKIPKKKNNGLKWKCRPYIDDTFKLNKNVRRGSHGI